VQAADRDRSKGFGRQRTHRTVSRRGIRGGFSSKIKVEVVVADSMLDTAVEAIIKAGIPARSRRQDFRYSVEQVIRIARVRPTKGRFSKMDDLLRVLVGYSFVCSKLRSGF